MRRLKPCARTTTTETRAYSTLSGTLSGDVYRWFDQNLEFMSPNNKVNIELTADNIPKIVITKLPKSEVFK